MPSPGSDQDSPTAIVPPRWVLPTALVPILTIVIFGYVANALWATLLEDHPAWLITLSPINRYLLLTTNRLDAGTYYGIGLLRHMAADPFFYLLGYWFGPRALAWAGSVYPIVHRIIGEDGRGLEAPNVRKLLLPIAFMFPSGWGSLLCGAGRIRLTHFLAANAAGTAARLVACRLLGQAFASEIRSITDFVARYQTPATIISIAAVMLVLATQFRQGTGELVGLGKLNEDLEED